MYRSDRTPSVNTIPPRKLPVSNFDPGFPLELIVGVSVPEEETGAAEVLWAGPVAEDGGVRVVFPETALV